MPNGNVQIVREFYQALQAGDLETLFAAMASDIEWEIVGRRSDLPTFGPRRGVAQVRELFRTIGETFDGRTVKPYELHAVGNLVFAMGSHAVTVRRTGRRVGSDWLHALWVKHGKIVRFREFTDTASFVAAWRM